jgi:hypothetical protein
MDTGFGGHLDLTGTLFLEHLIEGVDDIGHWQIDCFDILSGKIQDLTQFHSHLKLA